MAARDDERAPTIHGARSLGFLLRGQLLHAGAAVVLGAVAWALAASALGDGSWLGVADTTWFRASVAVGLPDPSSLALPRWLQLALGVGLLVPAAYTMFSVVRYFGFGRALGGDHFRESYRTGGLVDRGAFGWSPNAMYTFAFLGRWAVAFLLGSQAALVAAIFQHAFVWAHYLGTEQPDMELIYGG